MPTTTHQPAPNRTPKGRRTRGRIVEAAAELMLARGIAGTTLDDIGVVAGVGRSQIYHYFADKSALVHDVIRWQTDVVVDEPGEGEVLSTWEAWADWRNGVIDHARGTGCVGGCPLAALGVGIAEQDAAARELVGAGFVRWEQQFHRGLETMRRRGVLEADVDTAALATLVLVTLQGGLLLAQVQRDVRALTVGLDAAIAAIRAHAVS